MLMPALARAESTILLENLDGPGEGLNDSTTFESVGGNPGPTLGEARLRVLNVAAAILSQALTTEVPIRIGVYFDSLGGTASATFLGFGGPEEVYRDFSGAPTASTWYPSALGDKHAGLDLSNGTAVDAVARFNTDVDGNTVLGTSHFYYGLDNNPPAGDINFLDVALHELIHGLGFLTLLDGATGEKLFGYDDVFLLNLERHGATPSDFPSMTDEDRVAAAAAGAEVHWVGASAIQAASSKLNSGIDGGHIEMYAPPLYDELSSLVHWAASLDPPQIMKPAYEGSALDLCLELASFEDIGWGPIPDCETPVTVLLPGDGVIEVALETTPSHPTAAFDLSGLLEGELGDGESRKVAVEASTYTVAVSLLSNWQATSVDCNDTDSMGDPALVEATINLDVAESVLCTFHVSELEPCTATDWDLAISEVTITAETTYEACRSITADTVVIESAASATLRAGESILLGEGLVVEDGAQLSIVLEVPTGGSP